MRFKCVDLLLLLLDHLGQHGGDVHRAQALAIARSNEIRDILSNETDVRFVVNLVLECHRLQARKRLGRIVGGKGPDVFLQCAAGSVGPDAAGRDVCAGARLDGIVRQGCTEAYVGGEEAAVGTAVVDGPDPVRADWTVPRLVGHVDIERGAAGSPGWTRHRLSEFEGGDHVRIPAGDVRCPD